MSTAVACVSGIPQSFQVHEGANMRGYVTAKARIRVLGPGAANVVCSLEAFHSCLRKYLAKLNKRADSCEAGG
jgi:hypothetical protein